MKKKYPPRAFKLVKQAMENTASKEPEIVFPEVIRLAEEFVKTLKKLQSGVFYLGEANVGSTSDIKTIMDDISEGVG